MTWDVATPAGSSLIKQGDNYIRELKVDIQTALRQSGAYSSKPAYGTIGFYFATDKSALYQDTGSAWQAVGYVFPAGTKIPFYQASAPTGWTRDTAANDKFLRVVSAGSPGSTGGTFALGSTGAGTAHTHTFTGSAVTSGANSFNTPAIQTGSNDQAALNPHTHQVTAAGTNSNESSHTHAGPTHGSAEHAYADVMLATKDAY